MATAIYRDEPFKLNLTATANQSSGDILELPNGEIGIVAGLKDVASGEPMAVYTRGQFEFPIATATEIPAGAIVEWDDTDNVVVASGGDFKLGYAPVAKGAGPTTIIVNINQFGVDDES